jgi:hypothetical protein
VFSLALINRVFVFDEINLRSRNPSSPNSFLSFDLIAVLVYNVYYKPVIFIPVNTPIA